MQNTPVIRTNCITKLYGTKSAVDNVSLNVYEKDIYGLIGSNGAGKTTLLRMIMGLIHPTSGSVEIHGQMDNKSLLKSRSKIGSIIETPSLLINMNAYDCLNTQRLLYGIEDKKKVDELIELVGLNGVGKKRVKDFSLGMKQRLSIAQALINEPNILILDEPTNGMDPQGIYETRLFLQNLRDVKGLTIIISSHILTELQQLATRFGIISYGKIIDEFDTTELNERTKSGVIIRVSDIVKALALINNEFDKSRFSVPEQNCIQINDDDDFSKINRLLVTNDIDVGIVAKTKGSLEKYFIDKVGA